MLERIVQCHAAGLTIVLSVLSTREGERLVATTWGLSQGKYGSLGRVSWDLEADVNATDRDSVARVLLWALWGADYSL